MEDKDKRLIEKLETDFHTLSSKEGWTKEDLEKMKDLQKLMYYMEVRCAMKEGGEYPGSEYMDQYSTASYASRGQMRSPTTGRYISSHDMQSGRMYGRNYYDDEKMHAVNELRRMHQNEQNPEIRMALERAISDLEMR